MSRELLINACNNLTFRTNSLILDFFPIHKIKIKKPIGKYPVLKILLVPSSGEKNRRHVASRCIFP